MLTASALRRWAPSLAAASSASRVPKEGAVDGLCFICICKQCWAAPARRWYSHDEARDTKARPKDPLKLDLLQLYKRVHPDLFHHSPRQREANEKSFALLQEYLQLARSDAQAAGPARGFRFDFYLQRVSWQDDAVGQAAESTSGDQADVQRVQLMLPPPGRRSPAQQQAGSLAPSTLQAVSKLLRMCGIGRDGGVDGEGRAPYWDSVRLVDFLPDAAEQQQRRWQMTQQAAVRDDPDAQVSIMKRAFQLGRGVSVQRQTGEQLTPVLLQRLAQALDLAPSVDLRGCIIRPDGGGEGTVSVEGHILLDRRHSPPTWARQLMLVDMERVSAVRSAMKAVQTSEMALAVAMGVPLVATAVAHSLDARYSAFMHRALAYARDRPPPGASVEDSCPVFVWPPDAQPPRRLFSVCADREMVLVPMNATPEQLWRCMEATAAESTTLLQSIRAREAEQARVRDRAMRTLRLRRLQRGDDVSAAQYLQCCRALYQNAAALAPVAQGLSLRVASSNGVSECGTYIDIQHDSL